MLENRTKRGVFMSLYNELERKEQQKAQTTKEFFADLDKKIKESRWFSCDVHENCETYRLDKIDVSFDIRTAQLVVMNKMGIETKNMDCRDSAKSVRQHTKHELFCELLSAARTRNFTENEMRDAIQQHSKKSCDVENIKNELATYATHRRVKRQKLGIRAIMRQSVMRAFRGRGL